MLGSAEDTGRITLPKETKLESRIGDFPSRNTSRSAKRWMAKSC